VTSTIVVGFDGSTDSHAALRWAAALAQSLGSHLVVVHAVGLLEHLDTHDRAARERAVAFEVAGSMGVEPEQMEWCALDGDPCSVLLRVTEAPGAADMVVVGTRGMGAHTGSVLGSTSLELAEHCTVPLVIVPATFSGDRTGPPAGVTKAG